jgi:hypothetical protein
MTSPIGAGQPIYLQEYMEKSDKRALATHIPLLIRVFDISEGDVLEVGTGWFSTLMLHWLAHIYKRRVYSYESSRHWYERALRYQSPYHKIIKVESWDELPADKHWGLVFIDHSPEARRRVEIERFKDLADYIVIHDTQPEDDKKYQYSGIWRYFKYKKNWTRAKPWASVVSNFKDLKNI